MRFHLSGKAKVNLHVTYTSAARNPLTVKTAKNFPHQQRSKQARTEPYRKDALLETFQLWTNMAMTGVFVTHVLNVLGACNTIIDKTCSDM